MMISTKKVRISMMKWIYTFLIKKKRVSSLVRERIGETLQQISLLFLVGAFWSEYDLTLLQWLWND